MFAALSALPSSGQDGSDKNWVLSIDFGIQAHDKRLFGFPKFISERILASQPEFFGTYQFGVSTARKVLHKKRFELFAGAGFGLELATFDRPFDHTYKKDDQTRILRWTNRYYQYLVQLPIRSRYKVGEKLSFSLEILPQFNFLTVADHTTTDKSITLSWKKFDFYSVEINPGLVWAASRFDFGLRYRVFQVKKIDRVLFGSILSDPWEGLPMAGQTVETDNPFKLWFSVGYRF